jgi:hypothetical protein
LDQGTSWFIKDLARGTDTIDGNIAIVNTSNGVTANAVTITTLAANGSVYGEIRANSVITDNLTVVTSNTVVFTNAVYPANITANNVVANTGIYGNLQTSSQPVITTVGNLTNLTVLGNTVMNGLADICGTFMVGLYLGNVANGGTVDTNTSNVPQYLINPNAATIASATILMPSTPPSGRRISFSFSNTITALTMTSSVGHTVAGALTTASNTTPAAFVFYSNVWYRTV